MTPSTMKFLKQFRDSHHQVRLSCWFGLLVWAFLITLYFDQRKNKKPLIKNKKLWSTWKTINEKIKRRKKHTDNLQTDRHKYDIWEFCTSFQRKRHENGMKVFRAKFLGLPWKSHDSAMKVAWKRHESEMNMIWWIWTILEFLKESAMNLPWKIVQIHCIIFLSYSYQTHATFMALSWRFHGTFMALWRQPRKTWLQTFHAIFMADSWDFHGTFYHFKTVMLK